jgi:hypothetical protein
VSSQRAREVFLNALMVSAFCAGWRGRALLNRGRKVYH